MSESAPRKRGSPSTALGLGNPIDVHVGKRIKTLRLVRGWTQEELAKSVDLSFQQVQKYERGSNRVSAGRLYELAKALNVPIQYFFDEYHEESSESTSGAPIGLKEESVDFEGVDRMGDAQLSELVRAFIKIEDIKLRRAILQMVLAVDYTISEPPL